MHKPHHFRNFTPVLALLCAALAQVAPSRADTPSLAKLKAAGANAPITILPVFLTENPSGEVADALGLTLEKNGFAALTASPTPYVPAAGATWEQTSSAFGEWVKANPPATTYVLFAEFVGTPRTGPQEVRFLLAERDGAIVLSDRQTPADADFKRTAGADPDPMGCSVLVAERMKTLVGLPPTSSVKDGPYAKLWAEKSRMPTPAERDAMKKASATFKTSLHGATVRVYPPLVNGKPSAAHAQALADAVARACDCKAVVATAAFAPEIKPTSNEQRRLWDFARALRDAVRAAKSDDAYVVAADYLVHEGEPARARCVHFAICTGAGEWVIVDFQNDQQPDFKSLDPKSVDDCNRLLAKRLEGFVK